MMMAMKIVMMCRQFEMTSLLADRTDPVETNSALGLDEFLVFVKTIASSCLELLVTEHHLKPFVEFRR